MKVLYLGGATHPCARKFDVRVVVDDTNDGIFDQDEPWCSPWVGVDSDVDIYGVADDLVSTFDARVLEVISNFHRSHVIRIWNNAIS